MLPLLVATFLTLLCFCCWSGFHLLLFWNYLWFFLFLTPSISTYGFSFYISSSWAIPLSLVSSSSSWPDVSILVGFPQKKSKKNFSYISNLYLSSFHQLYVGQDFFWLLCKAFLYNLPALLKLCVKILHFVLCSLFSLECNIATLFIILQPFFHTNWFQTLLLFVCSLQLCLQLL